MEEVVAGGVSAISPLRLANHLRCHPVLLSAPDGAPVDQGMAART